MLKSIIKEPLLHFLLLALLIFAGYALFSPDASKKTDSIIVTAPKIEQMATVFAKTWQRPPTAEELKGLIDDYVKEEVLVRQALQLGLDRDDTVVRRRLRQKMEFINTADADALAASESELGAYLNANAATFEIEPLLAFQHVFFSPQRRGAAMAQDVDSVLQALRSNPTTDYALLGDSTLLPPAQPLSGKTSIGQTFGMDFVETRQGSGGSVDWPYRFRFRSPHYKADRACACPCACARRSARCRGEGVDECQT